jgi:phage repressor protein C with HTH and peptisase S24 domain
VKDLVYLTVTGSSMEPTICPCDLGMLDQAQRTPKHDQIFVIRNDGEPLVKRLRLKSDGLIEIHSDNPDLQFNRFLVKRESLDIIGRVVWVAGKRN